MSFLWKSIRIIGQIWASLTVLSTRESSSKRYLIAYYLWTCYFKGQLRIYNGVTHTGVIREEKGKFCPYNAGIKCLNGTGIWGGETVTFTSHLFQVRILRTIGLWTMLLQIIHTSPVHFSWHLCVDVTRHTPHLAGVRRQIAQSALIPPD